jgi:mRNA-degrading endonuclease RelE of RelBE toxin-antitoxin system
MVDRINKALFKMSKKERVQILQIMQQITSGNVSSLDLKKLSGSDDIYRVRKGSFRVIFLMPNKDSIKIIAVERRSDTTYR